MHASHRIKPVRSDIDCRRFDTSRESSVAKRLSSTLPSDFLQNRLTPCAAFGSPSTPPPPSPPTDFPAPLTYRCFGRRHQRRHLCTPTPSATSCLDSLPRQQPGPLSEPPYTRQELQAYSRKTFSLRGSPVSHQHMAVAVHQHKRVDLSPKSSGNFRKQSQGTPVILIAAVDRLSAIATAHAVIPAVVNLESSPLAMPAPCRPPPDFLLSMFDPIAFSSIAIQRFGSRGVPATGRRKESRAVSPCSRRAPGRRGSRRRTLYVPFTSS